MAKSVKEYSIQELETLVSRIKSVLFLSDEDISERAGYNKGYISQTRSRGKVPPKLMAALEREFREDLKKTRIITAVSRGIAPSSKITTETIVLRESEADYGHAPTDKEMLIASLQEVNTLLKTTLAANLAELSKTVQQNQAMLGMLRRVVARVLLNQEGGTLRKLSKKERDNLLQIADTLDNEYGGLLEKISNKDIPAGGR